MVRRYYIDSNIWLNLWKKEGNKQNKKPYWKIAKEFLEKIIICKDLVFYSGFILKEVQFQLNDKKLFEEKLNFMKKEMGCKYVKATPEDYKLARQLETNFEFSISFFDCMHISLCKRKNIVLITRDKELIKCARRYIIVEKPEELL